MASHDTIPIWLDVDTGHDDAFAILLAAHHPRLHLLGISTTFGNAPLVQTTQNTLSILTAIKRPDIPVYAGASKPFCRETWHAPDIHGESGLDGTTCLPAPSVGVSGTGPAVAIDAMARALWSTQQGTAYLITTGALTNAALLFTLHPSLPAHLAGVSIMGGALGGGFSDAPMGTVQGEGEGFGNFTPFAEFNVYIDPEAARAVLENEGVRRKCTLVPLDITHLFLATESVVRGLRDGFGASVSVSAGRDASPVRKLFLEILTFFAKTYADVFGITAGPPLHDPLAVAAVLMPEVLDDGGGERFEVEVVIDGSHGPGARRGALGSQCGRTVARKVRQRDEGIRIPRDLDGKKVWRVLEECLTRAEERAER